MDREKQESAVQSTEEHFLFGTLVDLMLTSTKQEFDDKYVVIPDETKCSEAIKYIISATKALNNRKHNKH
jgi:hypothetical protein